MNLDLQSTQPVWFGVSNPRWSMGEETSPLRLWTVLHKCQHALATWIIITQVATLNIYGISTQVATDHYNLIVARSLSSMQSGFLTCKISRTTLHSSRFAHFSTHVHDQQEKRNCFVDCLTGLCYTALSALHLTYLELTHLNSKSR